MHLRLGEIIAFAVRDRDPQHLPFGRHGGERRVGLLDANADVLAMELQIAVAQHGAGQQARLAQNLKAVADAEHRPAGRGEFARPHVMTGENRAMAPGPQVVAVREPAREA